MTLSICSAMLALVSVTAPIAAVTVESLGIPLRDCYPDGPTAYARNPWCLVPWRGRIWIGSGNSSNQSPAANAGPAQVLWWDVAAQRFDIGGTIPEEQIDRFPIIDGRLWIPGHDGHGTSWKIGSIYRLINPDGTAFEPLRTVPGAIHVYDLAAAPNGGVLAALGTLSAHIVQRSGDGGHTWQAASPALGRCYGFIELNDGLCASDEISGLLFRWDTQAQQMRPVQALSAWLPGSDTWGATVTAGLRMPRWVRWRGMTVLIGATTVNDHQWHPRGLFTATTADAPAQRWSLPPGQTPWDLLVDDQRLVVLTSERLHADETRVRLLSVAEIADPEPRWQELATCTTRTFGRSFCRGPDGWYVGLGSDATAPHPDTGTLLRLR